MYSIRLALRALVLRPGFTAIAVLTLALGIGANAAIFSVADAALLRALPYPDAERLVMAWGYSVEVQARTGFDRLPWSPGDVNDFVTRQTTFASLASVRAERVNLTGRGEPERLGSVRVSANFFDTLGVAPVLGRAFVDGDAQSGRTVVIGDGLWRRRFGGDPAILGTSIALNGEPATVVGVLPDWFRFPAAGDLPEGLGYSPDPEVWTLDVMTPQTRVSRAGKSFALIGRLPDGVSLSAAQADLGSIAAEIARQFPTSNAGWTVRVLPLREQLIGSVRPALLLVLTAVGVLLLIACANVANLLLVRATARHHEVAVRQALGADRVRLMRQMLLESVVLSTGAGLAGLLVAWWGLRALLAMLPTSVPLLSTAGLDWRVVAFTFGVSALTGLVFGMVPALQAIRLGVTDGLRDGGRGTIGHRRAQRMRNTLVVAEVAMAVVMLIGAALLTRTVTRLLNVESGFRSDGVLAVEVALPRVVYGGERPVAFFESLTARLAAVPGVEAVGVTSSLPLSGTENLRQITIEGRPQPAPGQEIISDYRVVSPGYFRVMGIPLIDGEPLPAVPAPGSRVLLVNRQLAETYFPGEFPIGRRLKLTAFDQPGEWFTIGGVVGNTRHTALDAAFRPQVYVHHRVEPYPQMVTVLHTGGDPQSYAGIARAAVLELDRDQPVGRIATMAGIVSGSIASRRFTMVLVVIFAALALLLSLVGLYAVVSHSVAARTRELGVRLALGASPAGLLRLVIFEGLKLVAVGVVLGLAGALLAARFIQDLLFGVSAYDLATFVGVPLLLLAAAIAGCTVPARRAMRVDPMTALRAE